MNARQPLIFFENLSPLLQQLRAGAIMTDPPIGKRRNALFPRSRLSEEQSIIIVAHFCSGTSVKEAAASCGVTAKTVRAIYLELRQRIAKPTFNRWHQNYTHRADIPLSKAADINFAFSNAMGLCAGNETCIRNFELGNRSRRECRTCPLAEAVSDQRRYKLHELIDHVRLFYRVLGIRGERGMDPVVLFHLRLTHWEVLYTTFKNSRRVNDLLDARDRSFLGGGTLMHTLFLDLMRNP